MANASDHRCHCRDCERLLQRFTGTSPLSKATCDRAINIKDAVFQIVSKAHTLDKLSLCFADFASLEALTILGEDLKARPRSLTLQIVDGGPSGEPIHEAALSFLRKLSASTTSLTLDALGRFQRNPLLGDLSGWTALLVAPICLGLRELQLAGWTQYLSLEQFFQSKFPVLEKLHIDLEDVMQPLEVQQDSSLLLPSLVWPEAPPSIVSLLEAPNLRRLAIMVIDSSQEEELVEKLREWSKVEDLVIHNSGFFSPPAPTPLFDRPCVV